MDAYRAAIFLHETRNIYDQERRSTFDVILEYVRLERIEVRIEEPWTLKCVPGWAVNNLTRMALSPPISMSLLTLNIMDALETLALYRVCEALYHCCGGARYEALTVIEDTIRTYEIPRDVNTPFDDLAKRILNGQMVELDEDDATFTVHGSPMSTHFRNQMVGSRKLPYREALTTRASIILPRHYCCFSNDDHENLWTHVQTYLDRCGGSKAFVADIGSTRPHLVSIKATRTVSWGEVILAVPAGSLRVTATNSDPEEAQNSQPKDGHRLYYCDTCGAACYISLDLDDAVSHEVPMTPPFTSVVEEGKATTTEQSRKTLMPKDQAANVGKRRQIRKFSKSRIPWPHEFRLCENGHRVPFCSEECRQDSIMCSDSRLCATGVENLIVKQSQGWRAGVVYQSPGETRPIHSIHPCAKSSLFNHSAAQCAWSRLFARIVAEACESDLSPREHIIIALAGIANTESPESKAALLSVEGKQVWSFTTNVVHPIQQIGKIYGAYGLNQFDHLSEIDGDTINLVLQRIKTATRFTCGPRLVKEYGSNLAARGDWMGDDRTGNDIWVRSLDPVFWLIREANGNLGETANVMIVECDGCIKVVACPPNEIRQGDVLLREKDDNHVGKGPFRFVAEESGASSNEGMDIHFENDIDPGHAAASEV